jgi:iron complex transport system substrate-binding protein
LAGCGNAPPARHALRIVSINPCVDAVLAQVADPRTIAGISH